jgi:hypothetical protein
MSASKRLASRRRVLKGMAGGLAVSLALPFLDCFLNENGDALAATGEALPPVFGTWFWGLGLTPGLWEPKTEGPLTEMPPQLKPIDSLKHKVNLYSGMNVVLEGRANAPHATGSLGIASGIVLRNGEKVLPASIDSIIADVIGARTRFRSLEVSAVGQTSNSFSHRAGAPVNPAAISPLALYQRVFGPEFRNPNAVDFAPDPRILARQSVISAVAEQRVQLEKQVGSASRARLDEYFTSLRQLEQQLALESTKPAPLPSCTFPRAPEETAVGTDVEDATANLALFAGILAHALACDQTRVVNIAFTEPFSSLRKGGSLSTYHILTHEENIDEKLGYQVEANWFANRNVEAFASVLAIFDSIQEGKGTLLDRMALMGFSDVSYAKLHTVENFQMFTAGSAGGRLKTGLHIQSKNEPVTRLGLTLQQAFGVPVGSWGVDQMQTSRTITEMLV